MTGRCRRRTSRPAPRVPRWRWARADRRAITARSTRAWSADSTARKSSLRRTATRPTATAAATDLLARDRRDRVGQRSGELVVDAVHVPVDQVDLELLVHLRIVLRHPHHHVVQAGEDFLLRLVSVEPARFRVL